MKTIRTLAIAGAFAASSALAQQYPTHPITLLVPFAPGPTDTVARVIAQSMSKPLGQSIVIENKPSAGGILAPELVKNAKPDGYTLLIHHIGMATTPFLYRQLRFNPLSDFEYIGLINDVPMTLIGSAARTCRRRTSRSCSTSSRRTRTRSRSRTPGSAPHRTFAACSS